MHRTLLAVVLLLLAGSGLGLWLLSRPIEGPAAGAGVADAPAPVPRAREDPTTMLTPSSDGLEAPSAVRDTQSEPAQERRVPAAPLASTWVRGNVFSMDRGPLGGASVRALLHVGEDWRELGRGESGKDGIYRIEVAALAGLGDLAPGPEVWVHIHAPGHQDATLRAVRDPRAPDTWQASGRLMAGASLSGRVVDEGGLPVMNAEVNFEALFDSGSPEEPVARRGPRPARTDADGRFRIGVPAARIQSLEARHGARGVARLDLGLEALSDDHDVGDLRLAVRSVLRGRVHYPGGSAARGLMLVAQRVIDAVGDPTRGVVEEFVDDPRPRAPRGGPFLSRTRTGEDGSFAFLDLEPGSYTITEQDEEIPGILMRAKSGARRTWGRPGEGGPFQADGRELDLLCEARRLGIVLLAEGVDARSSLAGLALIPAAESREALANLPLPGGAAFPLGRAHWFRLQPQTPVVAVAWAPGRGADRDALVLREIPPGTESGEILVEIAVD